MPRIILFILLVLYSTYTFAGGLLPETQGVVSQKQVVVRKKPPHGPFKLFVGRKVGVLHQGEKVEIEQTKLYGNFGEPNVWLKVKGQSSRIEGWVDAGSLEIKGGQIGLEPSSAIKLPASNPQ